MPESNQRSQEESLDLLIDLLADLREKEAPDSSQAGTLELIAELLNLEATFSTTPKKGRDRALEESDPTPDEPPWRRKKPQKLSAENRRQRTPSYLPSQKTEIDASDWEKARQKTAQLEKKLASQQRRLATSEELINQLFPLMRQLSEFQTPESREALLKAVVPLVDQAIAQRSQEDRAAVANAIAAAIPLALEQQIKTAPKEVGSAIAPEMAFAIQEQTRLQPDAMSEALGPEMGRAIKTQIELERDAMVDALYPVIGDTIRKYMAEVIASINEKVEKTLSPAGIRRKIQARVQGVSEGELILQESMPFQVQAVFLIQKASGLVIQEAQPQATHHRLDSEMLAGMLTAIRQFINDCVGDSEETSELHEIDYDGDSRIVLEVAGYSYLAVVLKGTPSQAYQEKMRKTLGAIVQQHGEVIQAYDGNPETIPDSIQPQLEALLIPETDRKEQPPKKFPLALFLLVLGVAGVILAFWGVSWQRQQVASKIEEEVAIALEETPELSVYPLRPDVADNTLTLTGRVPTASLREQAAAIAQAQVPENFTLNNQITAVNVPPPAETTRAEVQRLVGAFNQQEGVFIWASYDEGKVTVNGILSESANADGITQALREIPGVTSVSNTWQLEPTNLQAEIFFDRNSAEISAADLSEKINPIAEILNRYPNLHLKITGYSDLTGEPEVKQNIANARSQAVKAALVDQGLASERLVTSALAPNSPSQANRVVRFEPFLPRSSNE